MAACLALLGDVDPRQGGRKRADASSSGGDSDLGFDDEDKGLHYIAAHHVLCNFTHLHSHPL